LRAASRRPWAKGSRKQQRPGSLPWRAETLRL